MVKKTVKVAHKTNGYDRVRKGKPEHVRKYNRKIEVSGLSKETKERIKSYKPKILIKYEIEAISQDCTIPPMLENVSVYGWDKAKQHIREVRGICPKTEFNVYKNDAKIFPSIAYLDKRKASWEKDYYIANQ